MRGIDLKNEGGKTQPTKKKKKKKNSSMLLLFLPPQVTCGSALKLEHADTGRLLHSQNIGEFYSFLLF